MRKAKSLPYYMPHKNLGEHVRSSSAKREVGALSFLYRKIRNYLFQSLAFNCPVNSIRIWLHRKRGVHIGNHVMLGMHCILDNAFPEYIYIEDYAALAGNNYVIAHSNPYLHYKGRMLSYLAPVVVTKGAWVGVSATLLPGTEIGECSVVSAGSIVSGPVPANCIVTGNPAVITRRFDEDKEIFSCYK
jgi:acetyltransferase-like isoleucine patch superfamily enzyme